MSQKVGKNNNQVYRLVLTGGPCGGKTTGQARLCTFFENLGWKVYRVPEAAATLLGGGVKFADLGPEETFRFQENLIRTMMQIESTFFDLAAACSRNCLVICDRGTMDASAYLKPEDWARMKTENKWNEVDMRDGRYNQVIHMVSAAKGAEAFYHIDGRIRCEGIELARKLDDLASQAWVGHPYYDVINNSTDFEHKVNRMIVAVCNRLDLQLGDRFNLDSKKRKFLVCTLPEDLERLHEPVLSTGEVLLDESGVQLKNVYPQYQDFIVVHDYLVTPNSKMQARIRRRGQNVKWDVENQQWNKDTGNWTYTHTLRLPAINKERPETKMQISAREYELLSAQRDVNRYTIYKKRRCFLWNNQYFQMDIYQKPCHKRCEGLILLETYTTAKGDELELPDFLTIDKEVTDNRKFSMYNLSKIDLEENGASSKVNETNGGQEPEIVAAELCGLELLEKGYHLEQNGHTSTAGPV